LIEDKLNVAAGGLYGLVIGEPEVGFSGISYGVVTYGSRTSNVTLGTGLAFYDMTFYPRPIVSFGGLTRLGKRTYLVSENYFFHNGDDVFGAVSLGGRYAGKGISADFALVKPYTTDNLGTFLVLPWLSITVPFRFVKYDETHAP